MDDIPNSGARAAVRDLYGLVPFIAHALSLIAWRGPLDAGESVAPLLLAWLTIPITVHLRSRTVL